MMHHFSEKRNHRFYEEKKMVSYFLVTWFPMSNKCSVFCQSHIIDRAPGRWKTVSLLCSIDMDHGVIGLHRVTWTECAETHLCKCNHITLWNSLRLFTLLLGQLGCTNCRQSLINSSVSFLLFFVLMWRVQGVIIRQRDMETSDYSSSDNDKRVWPELFSAGPGPNQAQGHLPLSV